MLPIKNILAFIQEHGLEGAGRIEMDQHSTTFTCWKQDTHEATLRNIKRVFGPMKVVETSWGDKYLEGVLHEEDYYYKAYIYGAYKCEIISQTPLEVQLEPNEVVSRKKQVEKLLKEIEEGVKVEVKTTFRCTPA